MLFDSPLQNLSANRYVLSHSCKTNSCQLRIFLTKVKVKVMFIVMHLLMFLVMRFVMMLKQRFCLGTMKNLLKQLSCNPQAQPPLSPPGQRSDLQNKFEIIREDGNNDGVIL